MSKNSIIILVILILIALGFWVFIPERVKAPVENNNGDIPKTIVVNGTWECLPHKDTSGPQTLECAFGILEDITGKHYAVDASLIENNALDYPTASHLQIEGLMVPLNQLSTDMWQKYPIVGIIQASSIREL